MNNFLQRYYEQKRIYIDKQNMLLLYLMQLRCRFLLTLQRKQGHNLKYDQFQFTYGQWFGTANSSGFINFRREIIKQSNDQDLWIQYNAYFNHQKQVSEKYHRLFKLNYQNNSEIVKNLSISQYLARKEFNFEEWHRDVFIWTSQFKNTRAFGYTQQTTMIPYFDYMNYQPISQINQQKMKFDGSMTKFRVHKQMESIQQSKFKAIQQKSDNQSTSQIDSDQQISQDLSFTQQFKLPKQQIYTIQTTSKIAAGQQILFSYGSLSNRYLLKWYGFALKNNCFDYFPIYINQQFQCVKSLRQQKLVFFTKIHRYKRCNLKMNKINLSLLRIMREKAKYFQNSFQQNSCLYSIISQQIIGLEILSKQLQSQQIPCGTWDQQIFSNQKQKKQLSFIKIYQHQMLKIYKNQIEIIRAVRNILNELIEQKILLKNYCYIENKQPNQIVKQLMQLIQTKLKLYKLTIINISQYSTDIFKANRHQ